jgi:hypothetical protein
VKKVIALMRQKSIFSTQMDDSRKIRKIVLKGKIQN